MSQGLILTLKQKLLAENLNLGEIVVWLGFVVAM